MLDLSCIMQDRSVWMQVMCTVNLNDQAAHMHSDRYTMTEPILVNGRQLSRIQCEGRFRWFFFAAEESFCGLTSFLLLVTALVGIICSAYVAEDASTLCIHQDY